MNEILSHRESEAMKGLNLLAMAYYEFQQREKAAEVLRKAIDIAPNYFVLHNNLVNVLNYMFRFDEALEAANCGVLNCPDHYEMYFNRGIAYCNLKRYAEGIEDYRRTVEMKPEHGMAHYNLGFVCCMLEKYEEGLPELEWRFKTFENIIKSEIIYSSPLWDGSNLANNEPLLVYNEQGVGELFHFARYFPLIKERAKNLVLETQENTISLMKQYKEFGLIVPKVEGPDIRPVPVHSRRVSLYSLFNIFRTIPNDVPYLKATPATRFDQFFKTSKKKVGFAYAGNPIHQNDMHRSIPIIKFKQLTKPNIQLFGLQKDVPGQRYYPDLGVIDYDKDKDKVSNINLANYIRDFSDTASIIDKLDLVISVDTSVAHLAGAMGKPVWILLPYAGDWRWGSEGDTTAWYPTARLFRQPKFRDWDSVFDRVEQELEHFTT